MFVDLAPATVGKPFTCARVLKGGGYPALMGTWDVGTDH